MNINSLPGLCLATSLALAAGASPGHADEYKYNPIAPCRIVDTRGGAPLNIGGAFRNGDERSIPLRDNGTTCTVPLIATAVVLNVVAVGPNADGFLTAYQGGITRPGVSNLNFVAGPDSTSTANEAVVQLGIPDVKLFASVNSGGKTDVVVDISGYFALTGAKFHAMTPCRLLDTRPGPGNMAPLRPPQYTRLNSGQTIGLPIQNNGSACTIPQGATAVFANLTAVTPSGAGHLTLFPAGPRPNVSTLNFQVNDGAIPNAVIVPLAATSPDANLFAYAGAGSVDAVLDISGYFQ